MSKVYVPSIPTKYDSATDSRIPSINLNPAAKYGQIISCLPMDCDAAIPDQLAIIQEKISEIGPDDFIVAVGDPIAIAAAIAYSNDMIGMANVLRWDRIQKNYVNIEVIL